MNRSFPNVFICLKRQRDDATSGPANKQPLDVEAMIIKYVLERSEYGHRNNINTRGSRRKILLIGRPYYWANEAISSSLDVDNLKHLAFH